MTKQDHLETTRKIKSLLHNESQWVQGVSAADIYGGKCSIHSYEACRWCWTGALGFVLNATTVHDPAMCAYAKAVCDELGWEYSTSLSAFKKLILFNDTHEFKDLRSALNVLEERFNA